MDTIVDTLLQLALLIVAGYAGYSFFRRTSVTEDNVERVRWSALEALSLTVTFYLVSQVLVALLLLSYLQLRGVDYDSLADAGLTLANFLSLALSSGLMMLLLWRFLQNRKASWKNLGFHKLRPRQDSLQAILGYGVYFLTFLTVVTIVSKLLPGIDLDQEQELGFSTALSGFGLVAVFVSLVIIPPIVEEILTRGFLYTGLRSKLRIIPAALITSIIFAIAHLQIGSGNPLLWVAAIDTFILSLVLIYLRERTGGLWSPILLHGTKNAVAFFILFIVPKLTYLG